MPGEDRQRVLVVGRMVAAMVASAIAAEARGVEEVTMKVRDFEPVEPRALRLLREFDYSSNFRPLDERRTDIELFKRLLAPAGGSKEGEGVDGDLVEHGRVGRAVRTRGLGHLAGVGDCRLVPERGPA